MIQIIHKLQNIAKYLYLTGVQVVYITLYTGHILIDIQHIERFNYRNKEFVNESTQVIVQNLTFTINCTAHRTEEFHCLFELKYLFDYIALEQHPINRTLVQII